MKPLEFSRCTTLDAALQLLADGGGEAGILAGGTDLIIQLRAGGRQIGHMVDIKGIPELNALSFDPSSGLRLGAAVSCARLTDFEPAVQAYPALAEGAELIGSTQIQNRATVGGNVCNGSPAADSVCPLIVLGAVGLVVGPAGRREISLRDFIVAPGQTALVPGELLVELRVPPPLPHSGSAYFRFIPRNEMDIAVAGAAASLAFESDGKTVRSAAIALGAVGPTPIVVEDAAKALVGSRLEADALHAAARASESAAKPITDMRGTVEFRRHLAGVLTRRAIETAARRAREGSPHGRPETWEK